MFHHFLNLFIDNSCYGCGQALIGQEKAVCLSCLSQLQETHFHLSPSENEVFYRLGGRVPIHGATSLYFFDKKGTTQRLIQALKYKDAPQLGVFLGKCLGETIADSPFMTGNETIVPVPLHPRRQLERGYNQAAEIAKGLAETTGLPLESKLLRRRFWTKTQTRKKGDERWQNVKSAFEPNPSQPRELLLVDDVITTGATLVACIKALMKTEHPPHRIAVASIAMARNH